MRAIDRAEAAMTLQLRERALLEGERQKPVDVTGPQANRFELLACEVLLLRPCSQVDDRRPERDPDLHITAGDGLPVEDPRDQFLRRTKEGRQTAVALPGVASESC
jgi:hypothetical protein